MDKTLQQLNSFTETIAQINQRLSEFEKTILSTQTAFPVRENLAAEAKLVVNTTTPLLNRFPTKPGSGAAAAWREITSFGSDPSSVFYAEAATPSSRTTVYAARSETYRQLALDGTVSGLALAAGANFQDQLAAEKINTIFHLKNLEEAAIISAPGTGITFSGLLTQIATANGSYVAATTATTSAPEASAIINDIDALLKSSWDKGAEVNLLVVRSTEAKLISEALTSSASTVPLRVVMAGPEGITGGFHINKYVSAVTGKIAEILPDVKHTQGTIMGIVERLPEPISGQGDAGVHLDVLLDYALSDVPATADVVQFRVKRYYTVACAGRKFFGKITGFGS
jgi:hypothetical protein